MYQVQRQVRQQGLLAEALCAVLKLGFEQLMLHRIYANFSTDSLTAPRVMADLGMSLEAHFVDVFIEDREWVSLFEYAMLDEEWTERLA